MLFGVEFMHLFLSMQYLQALGNYLRKPFPVLPNLIVTPSCRYRHKKRHPLLLFIPISLDSLKHQICLDLIDQFVFGWLTDNNHSCFLPSSRSRARWCRRCLFPIRFWRAKCRRDELAIEWYGLVAFYQSSEVVDSFTAYNTKRSWNGCSLVTGLELESKSGSTAVSY